MIQRTKETREAQASERRAPVGGGAATDRIRVEGRRDGQLWAVLEDRETPVRVRPLFPWSETGALVSLRDPDDREVAVVDVERGVDPASAVALRRAAEAARFVFEITGVTEVEDEIELRVWRVETRQGPRVFQTRLDDWPREVPGGGHLVRDVSGDLYLVPDASALDRRSRRILWALVG